MMQARIASGGHPGHVVPDSPRLCPEPEYRKATNAQQCTWTFSVVSCLIFGRGENNVHPYLIATERMCISRTSR